MSDEVKQPMRSYRIHFMPKDVELSEEEYRDLMHIGKLGVLDIVKIRLLDKDGFEIKDE